MQCNRQAAEILFRRQGQALDRLTTLAVQQAEELRQHRLQFSAREEQAVTAMQAGASEARGQVDTTVASLDRVRLLLAGCELGYLVSEGLPSPRQVAGAAAARQLSDLSAAAEADAQEVEQLVQQLQTFRQERSASAWRAGGGAALIGGAAAALMFSQLQSSLPPEFQASVGGILAACAGVVTVLSAALSWWFPDAWVVIMLGTTTVGMGVGWLICQTGL